MKRVLIATVLACFGVAACDIIKIIDAPTQQQPAAGTTTTPPTVPSICGGALTVVKITGDTVTSVGGIITLNATGLIGDADVTQDCALRFSWRSVPDGAVQFLGDQGSSVQKVKGLESGAVKVFAKSGTLESDGFLLTVQ